MKSILFRLFAQITRSDVPNLPQPIPDGCPGSASPQTPPPSVCATIPVGCPGSSQQGSVDTPPNNCPFEAASQSDQPQFVKNDCNDANVNASNCGIIKYLVMAINVLSGLVGLIIVLFITFRGLQYTFSRDDPQIAAKAKDGIRDAVLALVYFLAIFAFLQWIVPGGIF